MDQYINVALRYLEQLDARQWVMLFVGVVLLGLVCMKGFGSRSSY